MSTEVDQRVVEMRFDNARFEQNAATTISTLDTLGKSLRLSEGTRGFSDIDAAAKNVDLSGLNNGVHILTSKFSSLRVAAVTAIANLTNSAVNAGKRIASALTIDPVKMGFKEYETQINAVQTILANTSSKGTTIDDVNTALDELNAYADKTIYNFTEMTRNIGTFTAAGVDLDTSVNAIQGIANLAAVSGSTSQQASTAMYQLSQALSSGTVRLMDWNSVVNAGMGGEVFQNALKETARAHGIAIDDIIEKQGSFRESLSEGWLSAEILTDTLQQFTLTTEGLTEAEIEANREMLRAKGYTDDQIDEIFKLGQTATDAATKVKTFSQLWETLKESAQSGWSQTWEIIVGDFEEAKTLLTEVSNVLGGMIGESANARNALLQGWKDGGGRADLIESFKNAFEGILSVVKPIKEAFAEIFPPLTVDTLLKFTSGLKDLTAKLTLSDAASDNLKRTFKGLFAGIDILVQAVGGVFKIFSTAFSSVSAVSGGLLGFTAAIGDAIVAINEFIKAHDIFGRIGTFIGKTINVITMLLGAFVGVLKNNVIVPIIERIRTRFAGVGTAVESMANAVSNAFGSMGESAGDSKFMKTLSSIWDFLKMIGGGIASVLGPFLKGAFEKLENVSFDNIMDLISLIIGGGLAASLGGFIDSLTEISEKCSGFMKNAKKMIDGVRDCLKAYQAQLKAGTLMKIATAIAVLAGSLLLLSLIDSDKLAIALAALSTLLVELMWALSKFSTTMGSMSKEAKKGMTKGVTAIIGVSVALLIMASAVKKLTDLDPVNLAVAATAVVGLLFAVVGAMEIMGRSNKGAVKGGMQMILFAAAVKILASVCEDLAELEWKELAKGLVGVGALLLMIGTFANTLLPTKKLLSAGIGMIAIGAALKIMASAMADFGSMSWEDMATGLKAMGLIFAELALFSLVSGGVKKIIPAALAMIVIAGALKVFISILQSFSDMGWATLGTGLLAMAAVFVVLAGAAALMSPIIPMMLALSVAFALLGVGMVAIGAGMSVVALGLTAFLAAIVAAAPMIGAALTALFKSFTDAIPALGDLIKTFVLTVLDIFVELVPQIADGILKLLVAVLTALAEYTPQIVDLIFEFVIGLLEGLARHLPDLIQATVDVVMAFFSGVVDALSTVDTETIVKGIAGVGIITALMAAIAAVGALAPAAMLGVIGVGLFVAELALVFAAIGKLAEIPGLVWLINEGGMILQALGTAIGQFIGGLIGGIAQGVTSSFPIIGTHLSQFMTNATPFFEGAKLIDPALMSGVESLAKVILILTAANLLDGLTSWLTGGGTSLADFGQELAAFGPYMEEYAGAVKGIDPETVTASANAAKALSEMAANLPNSGGVISWFAGNNDMDAFGAGLVSFGKSLVDYSNEIVSNGGLNVEAINTSIEVGTSLANFADIIPNMGGVVSWFVGNDSLAKFGKNAVSFGKSLVDYSNTVSADGGLNTSAIDSSVTAATKLAELQGSIGKIGGVISWFTGSNSLSKFGNKLKKFGEAMVIYSAEVAKIDTSALNSASDSFNKLAGFAKGVGEINFDGLSSFSKALKKLGSNAVDDFIESFEDGHEKVTSAGEMLVSKAASGASSKAGEFETAGAYVVAGFANGITINTYKAEAAARAMAKAAADAAKKALDEHSPSKVFYGIGDFAGIAFVNSFEDNMGSAYDSGYSMADHARKGLSAAINTVTDLLNSEMDTQPTITPVLDLSDIKSGAGAIGDMLGIGSTIGVSTNIGAVNRSMSNRNQNGETAELISSMDKLRKGLGSIGNTTYSINGINYNGDSDVADAIQVLVRAAMMGGRA